MELIFLPNLLPTVTFFIIVSSDCFAVSFFFIVRNCIPYLYTCVNSSCMTYFCTVKNYVGPAEKLAPVAFFGVNMSHENRLEKSDLVFFITAFQ